MRAPTDEMRVTTDTDGKNWPAFIWVTRCALLRQALVQVPTVPISVNIPVVASMVYIDTLLELAFAT